MKAYLIRPLDDAKGDPIYRAISSSDKENRKKLIAWYLSHQEGRAHTRATFGEMHFHWNGPKSKKPADYPSCTVPGGIWSVKAVEALRPLFEENGDLFPIILEGNASRYVLFDCWSKLDAKSNEDFFFLKPKTLRYINIAGGVALPDVFFASTKVGLMVSERFKAAAEAAGLTGIEFFEAEVIVDLSFDSSH